MSEVKFAAAKELIQERHYDEARAILRTIDEPRAQDWLKKLKKYPARREPGKFIAWLIAAIAVIVAAVSVTLWIVQTRPAQQSNLDTAIKAFCATYGITDRACVDLIAKYSQDDINWCYDASQNGTQSQVFAQCMYLRGFQPNR